ncbi:ABC transporter G family member 23-like isoform X2 [Daktulosphaira vitifoliae]|uniref:ABC transporter G family member 23-like isoform X2 n=1 Tax=Daktulosphaira vitifoliae TaxID=58002 RepID=UPI0021A9E927|nr:ABC transporter G family member 23-like isoform X2 [Daktulosphaira vitifoliae]
MEEYNNSSKVLRISNAYKTYDNIKNVIDNFSMAVQKGCIYGLLGPSGCGKTTLLNCIIGIQTLDWGSIDLQVQSLANIGYMPQDICLDHYLTVKETLMHYGALYNMEQKKIESKIQELKNILQLNFLHSFIKDLSGGQCRTVSIAVSLLHDPQLIILDEPTVGLDVLMIANIWNYFLNLSKKNGKTIIITTHYIHEASQADMRRCHNTQREISKSNNILLYGNSSGMSRSKIKALFKKNWSVLIRDFIHLMFLIVLPIIQIIIVNLSNGTLIENIDIAVDNKEVDFSKCTHTHFNGCIYDNVFNGSLSCSMSDYLRSRHYNIVKVKDEQDGIKAVAKGHVAAFISFSQNYTNELHSLITRSDEFLLESTASVYLEGSYPIKNQMFNEIFKGTKFVLETAINQCDIEGEILQIPMNINEMYGSNIQSFKDEAMAKVLTLLLFYFSSVYSASFMLMSKLNNLLIRPMTAGVTIIDVIFSLFLNHTVANMIQITIMFVLSYMYFENPIEFSANLCLVCVVLKIVSWTGFLYGVMVSGITTNSTEVMFLTFGYIYMQVFVGGILWPTNSQTPLLRFYSENLPITVVGRLINNIFLKSWSFTHPLIMIDFIKSVILLFLHLFGVICVNYLYKNAWIIQK